MPNIISIKHLEKRADFFANASLSSTTRKAYKSDWKSFSKFCKNHDLLDLPATPEIVCLFLTDMADNGRSVSTIVRKCTSITAVHDHFDYLSPVKDAKVHRVLRGIRRECGAPQNRSKSISWDDLQKIVSHCDSLMIGLRDAAILAFGWTSAMRRSEIVALNVGDLDFTDAGIIVTIQRSKTDQEGAGHHIGIPCAKTGLCPVKTVHRWLKRVSEDPLPPETPLFPRIGRLGVGKWWWKPSSVRLKAKTVNRIVKQYCQIAGMNPELYSAHSLRRGLATAAGAAGVPERIISRHTRHSSLTVLRGYIDEGTIWQENPLSAIYPSSSGV
ncbi:MAG: site-specific integrase [Desulfobacteraceae bacterium]|nr:site-specific integrase [Desulfobacteraceae bacterium]